MKRIYILIIFCVILSVLYSTLSIVRHMNFQSGGFDLGLYDQAVWRFAHFLEPYNTVKERMLFGDHLVLTLPFFGILFYMWEDVRMLLIAQAVIISFSAIPIYSIAKKRLSTDTGALCIAVVYSLFYGIQYGVYFDFHPVIIGVALISWLAYFWETGKTKLFWVTFCLTLITQENMGLAAFCLAALFIFRKGFRRRAVFVGLFGIGYSLAASKIIAGFSPVGFQYWPQFPGSMTEAVTRLFDSPEKQQVWLYSYASFAFLPIFSPGALIAVLIDLSQYFVTGAEFSRMWSPFMHHRAILAPFLALGTIDVIGYLKTKKTYAAIGVLIVALGVQYFFHLPLNKLTKTEYWKQESWMTDTRKMLALVPKNVSIAAQQNLVPHLSHRIEIYVAWPRERDSGWRMEFGGKPEYLVVDTRPGQWLTQILETNEHWIAALENMEKSGEIHLEKQVGDMKLYKIIDLGRSNL